ncbi:MAG TPA: hypothetical protein RMF84_00850 [Polyangiaceae bacterium LLY-WYZ-14_1]|nr:hypothetical protein [Polyangiaceae bacterium LLY-WYZ-14_1]
MPRETVSAMVPAMRIAELGPLTCRLAGGVDREGGGDGPLVVLCHGFGAPGDDLVGLWRLFDVPSETRFAFPEAPLSLPSPFPGMEARAWWPIDMVALERALSSGATRNLMDQEPPELADARGALDAAVTAMVAELQPSKLVLGGFSQGSMLALDLALRTDRELAGLCLFSSSYFAAASWKPRMAARAGLSVFQSHGRQDPILPFSLAELLRDDLRAAGLEVAFAAFEGPHGIPPEVVASASAFLRTQVLDGA